MSDGEPAPPSESEAEIRRVCAVLESVAAQYAAESEESRALADAAAAYIQVHQHRALRRVFLQMKALQASGEFTGEMLARLKALGIDPETLEEDA